MAVVTVLCDGEGVRMGEDGGVRGPVAPGTIAWLRSSWILSLYFSFNCSRSLRP